MDAMCVGMAVSDVLVRGWSGAPEPGDTAIVSEVSVDVGGDALNQSIVLARLGHDVGLMTLVGSDPSGRLIEESAARAGVDTSLVARTDTLKTSTSVVLVDSGGERSFLSQRGATADSCGPEHFGDVVVPSGLGVLSVGSLLCSEGLDRGVLPELLTRARAAGALTIADMVNDRVGVDFDELEPILSQLDIIVPSLSEARLFTGQQDPVAAAREFLAHGVSTAVVKCGTHGAVGVRGNDVVWVDAYAVPVVDTTGSGDNFVAGVVSGILDHLDLERCLQRGAAVAALSVQALGATGSRTSRDDLEGFVGTHGPAASRREAL